MFWDLDLSSLSLQLKPPKKRSSHAQSGHGTGKTGNLDVTFPDRENTVNLVNLIFYTGKIVARQGKF